MARRAFPLEKIINLLLEAEVFLMALVIRSLLCSPRGYSIVSLGTESILMI
jgi:hypothetical protein